MGVASLVCYINKSRSNANDFLNAKRHAREKPLLIAVRLKRLNHGEFSFLAIVSGGDWLGKPANIKVENNGAVGYVVSFLTVHNPLFFIHKL